MLRYLRISVYVQCAHLKMQMRIILTEWRNGDFLFDQNLKQWQCMTITDSYQSLYQEYMSLLPSQIKRWLLFVSRSLFANFDCQTHSRFIKLLAALVHTARGHLTQACGDSFACTFQRSGTSLEHHIKMCIRSKTEFAEANKKPDSLRWFSQRRSRTQVLCAQCVRCDVLLNQIALLTLCVMHHDSAKCHIWGVAHHGRGGGYDPQIWTRPRFLCNASTPQVSSS